MRFIAPLFRSDRKPDAAPIRRYRSRPSLERCEGRILLTTYTVTALTDLGAGQGTAGDLRYCLQRANSDGQRDTINFNVTGTIPLGSPLPSVTSSRGVTIAGPGAGALTIQGGGVAARFTILRVKEHANAVIAGLTFANGNSVLLGGGILNGGRLTIKDSVFSGNSADRNGGAINNIGTLKLTDSVLVGNSAGESGGGIYSLGALTISNTTFANNSAESSGGGVESTFGVTQITGTTFDGNSAGFFGGAISINGPRDLTTKGGDLTLVNSALRNNIVGRTDAGVLGGGFGGGIASNDSNVRVSGTSFTGNQAGRLAGGVGINGGALTLDRATFTSNATAGSGGGLAITGGRSITNLNVTVGATLTANQTTFVGNMAGRNGGGIESSLATLKFNDTIIANNTANAFGGGLSLDTDMNFDLTHGTLTLNNANVNGNKTGRSGGGISNFDFLILKNTAITNNSAGGTGGGVFNGRNLQVRDATITGNRPNNVARTT